MFQTKIKSKYTLYDADIRGLYLIQSTDCGVRLYDTTIAPATYTQLQKDTDCCNQPTNQPTKDLPERGDLRESASRRPTVSF